MDIRSPGLAINTSLGSLHCSTQRETMRSSSSRDTPPVYLGHETYWRRFRLSLGRRLRGPASETWISQVYKLRMLAAFFPMQMESVIGG